MSAPHIHVGPIVDAQNRLRQDYRTFAVAWAKTKDVWRDKKREQFEQEHLRTIGPALARLSTTLDQLLDFAAKSDRALSDRLDG